MLTEPIHTEPHWAGLSGTVLEGGYEFEELLEAEQDRAKYKVRVLGGGGIEAFGNVFRATPGAQNQVALWEMARRLDQVNLYTPLAAGSTQLDGIELIYAVWQKPDEMLDGVLRERALTAEEAGEVLVSISYALERLHRNDLVHGCVSPEQIAALRDKIQLSTESIRRPGSGSAFEMVKPKYVAPESGTVNVTPAADVWCLGATLFETLTQKDCGGNWREQLGSLPAPFSNILERCLDPDPRTRCELLEVLALYKKKEAAAPQPQRVAIPLPELARIPQLARTSDAKPLAEHPRVRAAERHQPEAAFQRFRMWIYGAAGVVLILLLIWAARPKHPAVSSAPAVAVTAPAKAPATNPAWETRTLAPEAASAKPQKAPPPPVEPVAKRSFVTVHPASPAIRGSVWRVVLYAYNRAEDAERRVHAINQTHPDLAAQVFSPNQQGGPYLVTVGGRMSRDDAARLREKALRAGMPRDSYIQNYQQ